MKRAPLKRKNSQIVRKPIKKKKPSDEKIAADKLQRDAMWELFEEHWQSTWVNDGNGSMGSLWAYHRCESCNCCIYGENRSIYHHHVLPKAKHKEYALCIDNLILLCGECHVNIENGKATVQGYEKMKEIKQKVLQPKEIE